MSLFSWLRSRDSNPRDIPASQKIAYAYWSCLSETPKCKAQSDIAWIPGMANPPKPRGCHCDLVYTYASERGAPEFAAFIRKHGGTATFSSWDETGENPAVIERRLRARLDTTIEKEGAARQLEKEDPSRSVELYREVIAEFTHIASAGDEWTWRRLPPCYNRVSMLLERLDRTAEAIETIRSYHAIQGPVHPTKADAEGIAKRLDRLSKIEKLTDGLNPA